MKVYSNKYLTMLSALLLIPIIGSLLLLPINDEPATNPSVSFFSEKKRVGVNGVTLGNNRMKQIALTTAMINFVLSIILWGEFDSSSVQYQFVQEFNNLSFCHLNLGIDGISLYFVLLTTFITPICILANWDNIKFGMKYFLIAFLVMETLLIAVFVVLDLMLFYIFFESVLIPMFLVVGIWGGSVTRIRASFLLFLYTLAGSLFMLLAIMVIYYNVGSTDFTVVSLSEISLGGQKILWLAFFLSFAVKTPLVPLHIWLPRAHAEAPLGASILLAAVFLKMATYGYLRILIPMLPDATIYFSPLVQTLRVLSIIYSSLATLRQTDFKALVAYSSVGHMGVVILGLFSNTIVGIEGAILLSIAHGLISPAMFILVGGVLYDRFHTRVIRYYRGLSVYMPMFSVLFFLATAFNMAVPLSLNWVGEILSFTGMFQKSPIIAVLGASSIVLSACYSIFLFNRLSFGAYSQYLSFTTDISRRETMLLLPLLLLSLIFGIMPNILLTDIHVSVTQLICTIPSP
jgi:NADH-ubiquinone oxidoreductase chain 4